jgi:hypothetical protein
MYRKLIDYQTKLSSHLVIVSIRLQHKHTDTLYSFRAKGAGKNIWIIIYSK